MPTNRAISTRSTAALKKNPNSYIHHTVLAIYNFVYFVAMIVICADAHWARGTKANPLYINFNQMPYIGLWQRCIVFYGGQDQSGSSGRYQCTPMDPSVQVLPGYLIYTRAAIILSILFSAASTIVATLSHPYLAPKCKIDVEQSKKMTYTLIWLQAFTSIISIIACVWFTAAAFSNGLGWMTGSNAPVEFVQSYVSAWKPAWCLDVGLCVNAVELGMAFYTLWAWMHMEPITEESEEGGSLFEYDEEVDDEIEKIKQRAKAKRLEQRLKQAEDREKEESLVYPSPSWKRYDPSKKQTQAGWI